VRTLLKSLCEQVSRLETLSSEARVEREESYNRILSFDSLKMRFIGRTS
jgi:hypothetical protein